MGVSHFGCHKMLAFSCRLAPIMASPEYAALQKSTGTLCDNISAATTPTWFAQKLQERGLITPQLQDRTLTLGVPDYDKVSKLLQAVLTQVKANSGKFRELVDILGEEPALETSVTALTKALEGIHVGTCMEEGVRVVM